MSWGRDSNNLLGCFCIAGFVALNLFSFANAQVYPSKPISLVVSFSPGAASDSLARIAARRMSELLKQQIVVLNRDGASGTIGAASVAKAAPDGYTLLWGSSGNLTIGAAWANNLPYDPIRDFSPIGGFAKIPFFLVVHPSVPAHSVAQLVALAKTRPGQMNYGSAGAGSFGHMATELFKFKMKISINHVPYRGAGPFSIDLLAGQIELGFVGSSLAIPHSQSGRLRVLATTASERATLLMNVPTMAEAGVKEYEFTQWYGLLAPANTPHDIVSKLSDVLKAALDDQAVRKRVAAEGGVVMPTTSDQFMSFLKADVTAKTKLVRDAGIKRE